MGKLLGVVNKLVHLSSTLPKIFHRNIGFEIKIIVSHCEIFAFFVILVMESAHVFRVRCVT